MYRICCIVFGLFSITSHSQLFVERTVTEEITGSRNIIVADMDNDGNVDILNINRSPNSNYVWIRNNNGAQSFGTPIAIGSVDDPHEFTAADLDGDGDTDVVGTRLFQPDDKLVWFENLDGLGNFGPVNEISTTTEGQGIVKTADLDGDLDMDIVVNSRDDGTLSWYENLDGLGDFGPSRIIITNYVTFTGLDVGDIDGDGDIDIVAGTNNLNRMAWFENTDGLGTFSPPNPVSSPGLAVTRVYVIDINGDDNNDILGISPASDLFVWYENTDGMGSFSSEILISSNFDSPTAAIAADLDNDSDTDVAIIEGIKGNDRLYWFENIDGMGTFGSEQLVSDNLPFAISLAVTDLDNDGDQDLVSAPQTDSVVMYWYENQTILGVDEQLLKNDIVLYPNPAQSVLIIATQELELARVTVTDIKGKQVFTSNKKLSELDISNYATGTYVITLEATDGSRTVKKFVKK